jgi:hypothetical protein
MIKHIAISLAALISMPVMAGNIWCGGNLTGVYVTSSADVIIKGDWRNDWTKICNLKSDSIDTVTCSLWSSYAASALQNDTKMTLMYSGDFQCDNIPTYGAAPSPIYIMLNK